MCSTQERIWGGRKGIFEARDFPLSPRILGEEIPPPLKTSGGDNPSLNYKNLLQFTRKNGLFLIIKKSFFFYFSKHLSFYSWKSPPKLRSRGGGGSKKITPPPRKCPRSASESIPLIKMKKHRAWSPSLIGPISRALHVPGLSFIALV